MVQMAFICWFHLTLLVCCVDSLSTAANGLNRSACWFCLMLVVLCRFGIDCSAWSGLFSFFFCFFGGVDVTGM